MAEKPTIEEVVRAFENIDGIKAFETDSGTNEAMVEVMDESAIGSFFATARRLGVKRYATTRSSPIDCVMDSFVSADE